MSQIRSIVAGGTAAVLLLGIGTSILFAGPPRASGEIGGPVIVTAASGTDPPPAGAPSESAARSAAVQAPSAGPPAQAAHAGALSALPDASPTAHDTPVSARERPRPHVATPPAAPAPTDAQPAGRRLAATATRRDETRTTVAAGRAGAREPWPARIPTPHRADACRSYR